MSKYIGRVWRVGNDIDTDLIIAARHLNDASPENLRKMSPGIYPDREKYQRGCASEGKLGSLAGTCPLVSKHQVYAAMLIVLPGFLSQCY